MKVDGKHLATAFLEDLAIAVETLRDRHITPHLAVFLVGDDPASSAYVKQKQLKGEAIGMKVTIKQYDQDATTETLLQDLHSCNTDPSIHGIIIQQPLPTQIDAQRLIRETNPAKDVDGFHKESSFTAPIAEGVEELLKFIYQEDTKDGTEETFEQWLSKKNCVVIGKGETGGAPIIRKLQTLGTTPKIIDSKTEHPDRIKQAADIIISCVGKLRTVTANDLKQGVILLSIGMFRGDDGKLHGDYEEDEIKGIASYYTPVPGGVGPMNVAMLLRNVIAAAKSMKHNTAG